MTMTFAGAVRASQDSTDSWRYRGVAALLPDRRGLVADIHVLTHRRTDGGAYPTVDHGAVRRYSALYICWAIVTPDACSRLHQPEPELVACAAPVIPAADWAALRVMWERWHAAELSPGCVHQTPPLGTVRQQLAATPDCPEDGYRFGTDWLVRELPDHTLTRAHQVGAHLQALPR